MLTVLWERPQVINPRLKWDQIEEVIKQPTAPFPAPPAGKYQKEPTMKIGRNDPCPCGSGIKYKKCCAGKQQAGEQPADVGEVTGELRELLQGQSFGSLDEANAFLNRHMRQRNQAPSHDFQGLSPEQVHRFLHFPFDTPALINFPPLLDIVPQAPVMTLFNLLVNAIGDEGLKTTATGNLPRNFCRDAALSFLGEEGYGEYIRYGGINSETDFSELHTARLVAETARLIRKNKGKFITSKECRKILSERGMYGTYPRLFQAFAGKYNWGYQDRYPDYPIIQQSFLFTLYLLQRYGNEWRSAAFYSGCFLRAFPMVLVEVRPLPYETPEDEAGRCYSLRSLERFAEFLGLVEIKRDPSKRFTADFRLRKLPLLDHVVQFQL